MKKGSAFDMRTNMRMQAHTCGIFINFSENLCKINS